MHLTSTAFEDGGRVPERYTCDGDDVSPPLAWSDVPDGVREFALIVDDPDADGFAHWVLIGIPADVRELKEDEGDRIASPGPNGFGRTGWAGPCPPSGSHRYVFTLYALSEAAEVGRDSDLGAVRGAISDHVMAEARLTATYERSR